MSFAYLSPSWFFDYDVFFEIIFFLIAMFISIFAYKVYKKSYQDQVKFLSLSFFLISLSYLLQSIFNFVIINEIQESVTCIHDIVELRWFYALGVYSYMILMLAGIITLLFMTLKSNDYKIYILLLFTSLMILFLSNNVLFGFLLIISFYLFFISAYFVNNYIKNKQSKTFFIAIAFIFLLLGNIGFILSIFNHLYYVVGHLFELIAYLFILFNFYLVLK